jgi:hypothetical protein
MEGGEVEARVFEPYYTTIDVGRDRDRSLRHTGLPCSHAEALALIPSGWTGVLYKT